VPSMGLIRARKQRLASCVQRTICGPPRVLIHLSLANRDTCPFYILLNSP
jgi:hypothetical protein